MDKFACLNSNNLLISIPSRFVKVNIQTKSPCVCDCGHRFDAGKEKPARGGLDWLDIRKGYRKSYTLGCYLHNQDMVLVADFAEVGIAAALEVVVAAGIPAAVVAHYTVAAEAVGIVAVELVVAAVDCQTCHQASASHH